MYYMHGMCVYMRVGSLTIINEINIQWLEHNLLQENYLFVVSSG